MKKEQNLSKSSFKEVCDNVHKKYDHFFPGNMNEHFVVENVNDHNLRVAFFQGEYRWHYHENIDEVFMILEGELTIEIKDQETIFLKTGEFIKIPARTIHKTSAAVRTINLCFEKNMDDTVFVD